MAVAPNAEVGGTLGRWTIKSSKPGGRKLTDQIHKPSHVDRSSAVWAANTLSK